MLEPMLHGWRLFDGQHIRMSGYAARVMSLSWSAGGQWLATSVATRLVLWPFHGKDGPMGKTPRLLTPSGHRMRSSPAILATLSSLRVMVTASSS
jgi:hypothetical protein